MKRDSIIFDLDGTLWDSIDAILDAWNQVASKHDDSNKQLTRGDIEGIMGLQIKEIGQKLFSHLDEEMQLKLLGECCDIECEELKRHGGSLYKGLEETLEILSKKYKLFIVSNCQEGYIEAFYHYHQMEKYFVDYENAGRTKKSKGENIKLIMEKHNLQNPIYVGDTEGDLRGARYAGIPFVYAAYGFGKVSEYDYKVDEFIGLTKLTLS